MSTGLRWVSAIAATLLVTAIVIACAIAAVWSSLPLEQTRIVVDGNTVSLPALDAWQVALLLALAVLAVLLAGIVAAGSVAVGLIAALVGIAVAALAVVLSLLLVVSPVLLVAWLIWRLVRTPQVPNVAPI